MEYESGRSLRYLQLLAKDYPNRKAACSEIINLNAIRQLPKGSEYFFSDLHGEYEGFLHLLHSASGMIRARIAEVFDIILPEAEQNQLANLIYSPEEMLQCLKEFGRVTDDWKRITIYRLVELCRNVSSKYTRSKVRKNMPPEYAYILEELLNVNQEESDKKIYYGEIIHTIIEIGIADDFIAALCRLIQTLSIDSLHIIGDIFDRGPRPDIIMDALMKFPQVDIQWGNHDISWMGAACGNECLIANVVRMGISYNTFDVLEDGYGINLRPLSMFAAQAYREDPCLRFQIKTLDENQFDRVDRQLAAKMHKAIAVIQFKLVGQLLKRHPEYGMRDRNLLECINYQKGTVTIAGTEYPLLDCNFPTICPENPLKLTCEEEELMAVLKASFLHSRTLHRHIRYLYEHGGTYKVVNSNLLFHGCIPMTEAGAFDTMTVADGTTYKGKALMDYLNGQIYNAYFLPEEHKEKQNAVDFMWYLWCGERSPMFGKSKLAAFESYFVENKETHREVLNSYYRLSEQEEICCKIFEEFGLNPDNSHIINGHVPVKIKDGEKPVKAGGKLYVIDGGLSKAYQSKTGIAGYTLIFSSRHLALAEHRNYHQSQGMPIRYAPDISVEERMKQRQTVADTDIGKQLEIKIEDLKVLIQAYQDGIVREHGS